MTRQAATARYQSLLELNPSQVSAIEVLDGGGTHQEAAEAAGVNRVTVTRWARHHPAFVAELNRRKVERTENLATRTDTVTRAALEVVEQAVRAGDLSAALAWIRLAHGPGRLGSSDGSRNVAPLTPQAVIDGIAQATAINETMDVMIGMYRDDAVRTIEASLGE